MQAQLALPLAGTDRLALAEAALMAAVDREAGAPSAMVRRFLAWHRGNPHVYHLIERFVEERRQRRLRRCGMKAIMERVRWEMDVSTSTAAPKLNNNWTAYYARLVELHHPEWGGTFELRRVGRPTKGKGSGASDSSGEMRCGNHLAEPAGASDPCGRST